MKNLFFLKIMTIAVILGIFFVSFSLRKIDKYTPHIKSESVEIINKLKNLSLTTLNAIQENKNIDYKTFEEKISLIDDKYKEIVSKLNKRKVNKEIKEGLKYIRIAIVNYNLALGRIKEIDFQKSKNYLNFVNFYLNTALTNMSKRS